MTALLRSVQSRAAALGALAALGGYAAALALVHAPSAGPWSLDALAAVSRTTPGWPAHLLTVGALLALLTAAACAYAHLTPAQPYRPWVEVGAAAALGLVAFALVNAASQVAVIGRPVVQAISAGVLGAGLAASGAGARLLADRAAYRPALWVAAFAVAVVGAALSYANYVYAWNMVLSRGVAGAVKDLLGLAQLGPAWLLREVGPLALAVALPLAAHALGWGLAAQVVVGLVGVAACERVLGLRGPDWHLEGVPADIEEVGACLVAVSAACAARLARRTPAP